MRSSGEQKIRPHEIGEKPPKPGHGTIRGTRAAAAPGGIVIRTHNLGYPRIGSQRELKNACEQYWAGLSSLADLAEAGKSLRRAHWQVQRECGIDLIPCNDFSYYDQVLDMTLTLGAVPRRYAKLARGPALELYFAMARGYQKDGLDIIALEMTKWFDTNYHYLVPEFEREQS